MERYFKWTTPEQATTDEASHWASLSPEERLMAVETLRQATIGIYDGTTERLERVYRFVDRAQAAGRAKDRADIALLDEIESD